MSALNINNNFYKLVGVIDSAGNLAAVGLPIDRIRNIQTAATGTNYAVLPDVPAARIVRIRPPVDVTVRYVGETDTWTLPADTESVIYVATNSNQLELRRADTSNTQASVELLIGVY